MGRSAIDEDSRVYRVLILHSSIDGHTETICSRLQAMLSARGCETRLVALADCDTALLDRAELVVIGASIRYGRHRPAVEAFLQAQRSRFRHLPCALFSVNLVARKPGKDTAGGNPYLRRLLARLGWQPAVATAFAGRLDYPRCRPLDRLAIRLIMWLTHGPTDPRGIFEFTDWHAVERFGETCVARLQALRPPPARAPTHAL
ncbi:MAG: menaquinone-dependent protoporphyrinogen IX dehydrogenase [Candidatus Dactylopiibacterium sp.]|nr:menaquinone-dependent protoporphyrinogen IX dehydrogenase [Candidatus Dactylopiibacterium sp.]